MRPVGSYKSVCDVGEMCQDIAFFFNFPFLLGALRRFYDGARAHTQARSPAYFDGNVNQFF